MNHSEARALCARLGAGEITIGEAAEALEPAYREALTARAERDPDDPDAAMLDSTAWDELATAQAFGVISTKTYGQVCDAVIIIHTGQ